MGNFAAGANAYGISDRSGFRYRLREMRKEWNGLLVGPDEYEPKHPQLEPVHVRADAQALRDPRPDTRTEPAVEQLLGLRPFVSGSSGSAVITVLEPSHGRTTGDTVRFRKAQGFDGFSSTVLEKAEGYTITVVDTRSYTFTASSGTATTGSQRGGGANATVGPVTLEN
jgi:hypothetical protein